MSTLISNFELLFKPLTPGLNSDLASIGRRALQGYFISITNLETIDLIYTLEYRVSLPAPGATGRRDLSGAVVINDVSGDNSFITPFRNGSLSNLWTSGVTIPAGKTALVVLLPNVGTPGFFSGNADVEVRGTVSIALNCVLRRQIFPSFGFFRPQATTPQRVLVNVEHRTTFLPNNWPGPVTGDLDFDQVGTSVALASGRGEITINPQTTCFSFPFPLDANAVQTPSQLGNLGAEGRASLVLESMALIAALGKEEAAMMDKLAKRLSLGVEFGDASAK